MNLRLEKLFHLVADQPIASRARYFAEHGVSTEMQREVEELLAFDFTSDASLESHIVDATRRVLAAVRPEQLQCGAYRLGEPVGTGGMGAVYSAERVDGELSQRVAIKFLRAGADVPLMRQRFLAERQILATLSHPNIARLLDAGHRPDGQPYLVMEYVDGQPLDVCSAALPLRRRLMLFLKVCGAVSYLHRLTGQFFLTFAPSRCFEVPDRHPAGAGRDVAGGDRPCHLKAGVGTFPGGGVWLRVRGGFRGGRRWCFEKRTGMECNKAEARCGEPGRTRAANQVG